MIPLIIDPPHNRDLINNFMRLNTTPRDSFRMQEERDLQHHAIYQQKTSSISEIKKNKALLTIAYIINYIVLHHPQT